MPIETPFYYGRGIAFHRLNEARNKDLPDNVVKQILAEMSAAPKRQRITTKSKTTAQAMFAAFRRRWDGDPTVQLMHEDGKPLAEIHFDLPIPGSPHRIVGAMDEIVQYKEKPYVGDTKTANAKATEAKKKIEFGFSSQPLFYINAARMMGYPVEGMLYRVVTEHVPPKHWLIESKRTDTQLANGLRSIHQVAEMIGMLKRTFGIDKPWPHPYSFPCNWMTWDGKSSCEYSNICQRPTSDLTDEDLELFTTRIDHLGLTAEV